MPKPPSWLDRVNFITFFLSNPCNFPVIVYFETAYPALGKLVLRLVEFGLQDLITSIFRPKGLRSGRHGRKRKKGKKGAGIPEITELIANRIPGHAEFAARPVTDGIRNFWKIEVINERFQLFILIVDVVLEFWTSWQSAIIKSDRTHCEGIGRALRKGDGLVVNSTGWGSLSAPTPVFSEGAVSMTSGGVAVGSGNWSIILSAQGQQYQEDAQGIEMQLGLVDPTDFSHFYAVSSRSELAWQEKGDFVASFNVVGPASFLFAEYAKSNGPLNYGGLWTEINAFAFQQSG